MTPKNIFLSLCTTAFFSLGGCVSSTFNHEIAQKFYSTQDFYYLSPSNSSLASSILFNASTKDADEIHLLIDNKGFPDALSVRSLDPFAIALAYKKTKQSYLCTKGEMGWLITGPEKLRTEIKLPLLATEEKKDQKKRTTSLKQKTNSVTAKTPATKQAPAQTPVLSPADLSKIKSLVASLGKDPAALLPSGDITHEVTAEGETMESIALWYTFDPATTKTIGRINHLKSADLVVGTKVTIPAYLVHNNLKYNPQFQKSFGSN